MPSYYYHLKLELYPTADPSTVADADLAPDDIWFPSSTATIFDSLPSHPRKNAPGPSKFHAGEPPVRRGPSDGSQNAVIDCGAQRATNPDDDRNIVHLSERQWRERSRSFPPPGYTAGLGPKTAARDWRFGELSIESFDLEPPDGHDGDQTNDKMVESTNPTPATSLGPSLGGVGQATKARLEPLSTKNTEAGWGIVHLYREGDEGRMLYSDATGVAGDAGDEGGEDGPNGEGTILCIPSVPIYLSPRDFLGFIHDKWRQDISHIRMILTSRMNRYMVLMKFRDHRRAKEWRDEFDGTRFNTMDSEICHATFVSSITIETQRKPQKHMSEGSSGSAVVSNSLKPFPPPTPSLIELPTCTICLERMDDTTGLMTILCQHVFHCTCLQTWKGSGCPVCRATNPAGNSASASASTDPTNPYTQPFGGSGAASNFCSVCDCPDDLWICLICGNVGCGRYKGGHAKEHWKETAHSFSLELETQHVWDYAGDMWVHRLIRDKGDGKVVELPGRGGGEGRADDDVVPRAKLESIGHEYTHLLTSQLESQRIYFEEMVSKAADKAAKAAKAAEEVTAQAAQTLGQLSALREEHASLAREALPALEREAAREKKRADKAADLARTLGRSLQEERKVSEGLMARIGHVDGELAAVRQQMEKLQAENGELQETNRDLSMFISGQQKLKELEDEGKIEGDEVAQGTASLPEDKPRGKGKKKR